jgi:hypothetical protein
MIIEWEPRVFIGVWFKIGYKRKEQLQNPELIKLIHPSKREQE